MPLLCFECGRFSVSNVASSPFQRGLGGENDAWDEREETPSVECTRPGLAQGLRDWILNWHGSCICGAAG